MQSKFGMMGSTLSRRRLTGNTGIVSADSRLSRSLLKVLLFGLRRQGKWLREHGILKLTRQQFGPPLTAHIRPTPIGALHTHITPTRPITDSGKHGVRGAALCPQRPSSSQGGGRGVALPHLLPCLLNSHGATGFGIDQSPLLASLVWSSSAVRSCRTATPKTQPLPMSSPAARKPLPRSPRCPAAWPGGKDQLPLFGHGTGNTSFTLAKWGVLLLPPVASPW